MPAYVPRDAVGVSPVPFPGKNGQPPIDWPLLEVPFGRELDSDERAGVYLLLVTYSVQMADAFHAPPVQDVIRILEEIEDAADDQQALDVLLRHPTMNATLSHVRWEIFHAPFAPKELSVAWRHLLRDKRRRLQDRVDLRLYHRSNPAPIWVENPDGRKVEVRVEPETSLKEAAFAGLVRGIADFWKKAGRRVSIRKDRQKSGKDTVSPFIRFLDELLLNLPMAYRRNSTDALATAASKVLRS